MAPLITDESLDTRLAGSLRRRGRDSASIASMGLKGLEDPDLVRAIIEEYPKAVLVTADDHMPEHHPADLTGPASRSPRSTRKGRLTSPRNSGTGRPYTAGRTGWPSSPAEPGTATASSSAHGDHDPATTGPARPAPVGGLHPALDARQQDLGGGAQAAVQGVHQRHHRLGRPLRRGALLVGAGEVTDLAVVDDPGGAPVVEPLPGKDAADPGLDRHALGEQVVEQPLGRGPLLHVQVDPGPHRAVGGEGHVVEAERPGGEAVGMWLASRAAGCAGSGVEAGAGGGAGGGGGAVAAGGGVGGGAGGGGGAVGTLPSGPCRLLALRQFLGCTTTSSTGAGSDRPIRTRPSSTPKKSIFESVRSFSHSRVRRNSWSKRGDTHTTTADSSVDACRMSWPRWFWSASSSRFSMTIGRPSASVPSTLNAPLSTSRCIGVISMPSVWPSRSTLWTNQGVRSGSCSPQNDRRSSRSRRPRPSLSISIRAAIPLLSVAPFAGQLYRVPMGRRQTGHGPGHGQGHNQVTDRVALVPATPLRGGEG